MDIRRQYSLPNCTLVLVGFSDGSSGGYSDSRPVMSILTGIECHFHGHSKPLAGGRELFENLVRGVSDYAQQFLSGIPRPLANLERSGIVQFQPVSNYLHRLIVHPSEGGEMYFDLTTVHLFDLVEAVDQFLADSRTLPDIVVPLAPLAKRYAQGEKSIPERVAPAALGVTSLAVAAITLSSVPVPKFDPAQQQASPQPSPSPAANTQSSASPSPASSPTSTPEASPSPSPTASPTVTDLEAALATRPEINDPVQLRFLQRRLQNQIFERIGERRRYGEDLVYRVGVGPDGSVIGYRAVNNAARDRAQETPLPQLLYIPANGSSSAQEPMAQFRVVFTDRGVPQINPWKGYPEGDKNLGPVISDRQQIETLNQQLYRLLRDNWKGTPTYNRRLVFRVAVDDTGNIIDYEPKNQPAFDYVQETPLPKLIQTPQRVDQLVQKPLAQYQVVFRPTGVLEVGPYTSSR